MTRLGTCIIMALALTACGTSDDNGDDDGNGRPDGGSMQQEPSINGMPASAYYSQFTYAKTQTAVEGAAAFPTNADGDDAFVATVFLEPNGKLTLFYGEGDGSVSGPDWSMAFSGDKLRRRTGTWRVDKATLVLDRYMTCEGTQVNNKSGMRCTLSEAIITPSALSRGGILTNRFGKATPDDSEFADYVP